ncbi:MAG: hypothetical protein ACLRWQ_21870 [Flavonifractor plautii]
MNLTFPASYLQAKLNAELPPPHDMTSGRARLPPQSPGGRVELPRLQGLREGHLLEPSPFPSHRPGLIRRKGAFMDFFFDNLEGRLSSTLPHYDRPDGDEQDCRKRARDAEWNFRVSKGYVEGHLLESGSGSASPTDLICLAAGSACGLFAPRGPCSNRPARPEWG